MKEDWKLLRELLCLKCFSWRKFYVLKNTEVYLFSMLFILFLKNKIKKMTQGEIWLLIFFVYILQDKFDLLSIFFWMNS